MARIHPFIRRCRSQRQSTSTVSTRQLPLRGGIVPLQCWARDWSEQTLRIRPPHQSHPSCKLHCLRFITCAVLTCMQSALHHGDHVCFRSKFHQLCQLTASCDDRVQDVLEGCLHLQSHASILAVTVTEAVCTSSMYLAIGRTRFRRAWTVLKAGCCL
jgi:hypothetical protein